MSEPYLSDAQIKIAIPMNKMATTPDIPATSAQINVVASDCASTLTLDTSLSNTGCPFDGRAYRRQAAPRRKPMPATIASVA
jgi:hypothetical protein